MIEYYVNQINMGCMTIEQVPEIWREKVRKALRGENVEPVKVNLTVSDTLGMLGEMGVDTDDQPEEAARKRR